MRSHGMTVPTLDRHRGHAFSYDVMERGFNFRMDELRASLLSTQLRVLPERLRRRQENFRQYRNLFGGTSIQVVFADRPENEITDTGVHLMSVLLPEGVRRSTVMTMMQEAGIQTSIHYPPIHQFTVYIDKPQRLPQTEAFGQRQLTLPFHPGLCSEEIETVVRTLVDVVERAAKENR
jgi:dTDP-4-amino-4,6-dideoxygalactose transaminase